MERLEVGDRRSQGGSSYRRRSSDESDAPSGRIKGVMVGMIGDMGLKISS